jgi:hypothetical protein
VTGPNEREYEIAYAVAAMISRAIASRDYLEGVLAVYGVEDRPDRVASFTAAVDGQRRFADGEAA